MDTTFHPQEQLSAAGSCVPQLWLLVAQAGRLNTSEHAQMVTAKVDHACL